MASKKSSTSKATKIECNICVKNVSKTVKCPFCDFETCRECSIKYVLDVIQPKCMNCSKVWTRHVLFDLFGKSFVATKYKNKRQNDLFETEKALLPDTLLALNEEQSRTASEMTDEFISKWFVLKSIRLTEDNRENVLATVLKEITDCFVERLNLPHPGIQQREEKQPKEKTYRAIQQIKCPYEDCRGFVRMDNMTCGLCGNKVCGQCREIVFSDKKHDCDPNTVETINMLKKDTKPCPKCSVSIHKIEGCDQMFCVECRTAFSWKKLEIVTGTIHNPHYFDYLRTRGRGEIPRQIGDFACGGFPDAAELSRIFENHIFSKSDERSDLQKELYSLNRIGIHTEEVELPRYLTTILDNVDLRRSYLQGTITEATFKQKIQERNKYTDKRAEIHETLSTLVIAGGDIFRNLAGKCEDIAEESKSHRKRLATTYCEEALVELRELVEFLNSSFTKIGDTFNNVVPILSHDRYARGDGVEWIWTKYNPGIKKAATLYV